MISQKGRAIYQITYFWIIIHPSIMEKQQRKTTKDLQTLPIKYFQPLLQITEISMWNIFQFSNHRSNPPPSDPAPIPNQPAPLWYITLCYHSSFSKSNHSINIPIGNPHWATQVKCCVMYSIAKSHSLDDFLFKKI